jgi:ribosome maturation factor RimP
MGCRFAVFFKKNYVWKNQTMRRTFEPDLKSTRRGNPTVPSSFCPYHTSRMELTEKIAQLLDEKYQADEAFADCFTVEIELKPANKLYVFADSDSGMTFEKCQKLSRYLESHLDANSWLGLQYTLEVSSPGISRPLKFARQYPRNIGRKMEVVTKDRERHIAQLKAADDQQITLWQEVVEKEGKKKIKREIETVIPYDQIEKATVKLAF